jgi:DNA-binding beta-propeller fold protein YncE
VLSDDSMPNAANPLSLPSDIVVDAANGRALVAQPETASVMAVDLASGERTVFSDGSTPDAMNPLELAPALELDAANDRLLVIDQAARTIVAASLGTGARTVLSASESGDSGVRLDKPRGIALDSDAGRLLLTTDGSSDALIALEIDTAQRSILSNATTPDTQNPFHAPMDLVLAGDRAYVLEAAEGSERARIVSVDLSTGARSVLSSDTVPDSVNVLDLPFALAFDEPGNRLLVTDAGLAAVVAVDVASGSRTILSGNMTPDANLPFSSPAGIALDTMRSRAVVANSDMSFDSNVLGVDVGSGIRSLLSDQFVPMPGWPVFNPGAVAIDAADDRAFVVNRTREELLAIDLATGNRSGLSVNFYSDFGNPLASPGRIAYDADRGIVFLVNEGADAVFAIDEATGRRVYLLR